MSVSTSISTAAPTTAPTTRNNPYLGKAKPSTGKHPQDKSAIEPRGIWIANLDRWTTAQHIKDKYASISTDIDVRTIESVNQRRVNYCAVVMFPTAANAKTALEMSKDIGGKVVSVNQLFNKAISYYFGAFSNSSGTFQLTSPKGGMPAMAEQKGIKKPRVTLTHVLRTAGYGETPLGKPLPGEKINSPLFEQSYSHQIPQDNPKSQHVSNKRA